MRIIGATNKDLSIEAREGRFREDLFYRLNTFVFTLPPLRERKKDILLLAQFFLRQFASKVNGSVKTMSKEFESLLMQYGWKGNIRELKNCMERAVILADRGELTPADLPAEMRHAAGDTEENNLSLAMAEKKHIQKILRYTSGNKAEAARLLDIGIATLYRKIEEYKL